MIADDFKAIRERRNQLGSRDIIKEYVTPNSERELTRVEKLLDACPPGTVHLGTITAGTLVTRELLDSMLYRYFAAVDKAPARFVGKSPLLATPYDVARYRK